MSGNVEPVGSCSPGLIVFLIPSSSHWDPDEESSFWSLQGLGSRCLTKRRKGRREGGKEGGRATVTFLETMLQALSVLCL